MTSHNAVLFDLDGTLLDTAPDLALALNQLLKAHDRPSLNLTAIRPEAGHGCKGLLKLGLQLDEQHPDYPLRCDEFLHFYERCCLENTRLFVGMDEVLTHLEKNDIPWGIVTNKPARFTTLLLDHLRLAERAACVISGDSLPNSKPHPEPIWHACRLLAKSPSECLYVGDAETDVQASKAAGTFSLAALYGYIPLDEDPYGWQADGYIQRPGEIIRHLG